MPLLYNISVILLWCIEVHFPDPDVCYKHDDQEENKILASDLTNNIIKTHTCNHGNTSPTNDH